MSSKSIYLFRNQNFEYLSIDPSEWNTLKPLGHRLKGTEHRKAGDEQRCFNVVSDTQALADWMVDSPESPLRCHKASIAKWAMQTNEIAISTQAMVVQMIISLETMLENSTY